MAKGAKKQEFCRIRRDTGQHRRILLVAAILGLLAFLPIGARLWYLMVTRYEEYADLALRNQTRTTAVTAGRGMIYDRNMNILAANETVEDVYLDPQELRQSKADLDAVSQYLGQLLKLDAASLRAWLSAEDEHE